MKTRESKSYWTMLIAGLSALIAFTAAKAAETNSASNIDLKLLAEGLGAPETLVSIPDGSGRLLVAEQAGVIQLLDRDGKRSDKPFLDLREKIVPLGQGMEERGLLGLALHPQFKSNHKFYAVYSAPRRTTAPPQWDHTERLSEFKATGEDQDGELYVPANGINSVVNTRGKVFKLVPPIASK